MASQRVSKRTMVLAVLLVVGLAAFEARAQPPTDGPPLPGLSIDGPPPLPGLPIDGPPPLPGPPPLGGLPTDGMTGPPSVAPGMDPGDGGTPMPGPTPGGLFPPPGPPGAPPGPGPGMGPGGAPGGAVGLGGGPLPGPNPTVTGLREKLESTVNYFHAFWMFAALSLGLVVLVLLVLLVLLMKLMKRPEAEPGEHLGVGSAVDRRREIEVGQGRNRKAFEHDPTRDLGRSPKR